MSSLLLVGKDNADEHGVSGVNAGHLHLSAWHCLQMSGIISADICIHLNVVSRSRLAQWRCINLRYLVSALPLVVCSDSQCLLAVGMSAVRLRIPRP